MNWALPFISPVLAMATRGMVMSSLRLRGRGLRWEEGLHDVVEEERTKDAADQRRTGGDQQRPSVSDPWEGDSPEAHEQGQDPRPEIAGRVEGGHRERTVDDDDHAHEQAEGEREEPGRRPIHAAALEEYQDEHDQERRRSWSCSSWYSSSAAA